jgi:hypothetical protein
MVERARVHPKPLDGTRPRTLDRAVHRKAARARSDERGSETEIPQFALGSHAKIQLHKPLPCVARRHGVRLVAVAAEQLRDVCARHLQAREPQVGIADAMEEVEVSIDVLYDAFERQAQPAGLGAERCARSHLQECLYRSDLARRKSDESVGQLHARFVHARTRRCLSGSCQLPPLG